MPILFECPHCGIATRVDERYAGESGPCRNCGEIVFIPGVRVTAAEAAPQDPAAPCPAARGAAGRSASGLKLFALCVLIATPICIFLAAAILGISAFRRQESENASLSNIQRLLQAMRDYEEDRGTLPPAYVADANGKPMHSWRVLLLQYMGPEEQALFREYRLDEPWNSPHNRQLQSRMPAVYACPSRSRDDNHPSYLVVVGQETAFEGPQGVRTADIQDGPSTTILIVDVGRADFNWLEPRDLEFKKLPQFVGEPPLVAHHDYELHVGMADGTAQRLAERVEIRPWLTKNARDKPSR